MPEANPTRFLLYIDILGFKEMTLKDRRKVARIYAILDRLNVHDHPNFKTIVFSDTILTYNPEEVHNDEDRRYLVWYLTEFAEDLHHRLIGQDVWFRAVLIAGEFNHYLLNNIQCFFGEALIEAYLSERGLPMIGLAMHNSCLPYNQYFRVDQFNREFSFVHLARQLEQVNSFTDKFPSPQWEIADQSPDFPEAAWFVADLHRLMHEHSDPHVRAKALATWDFYQRRYPKVMTALLESGFDLNSIGPEGVWAERQRTLQTNISFYKRIGSGTHLSTSLTKRKRKAEF